MNNVGTISLILSGLFFLGYMLFLRGRRYRHIRNIFLILSSALVLFGLYHKSKLYAEKSIAIIPSFQRYGNYDAAVAYAANIALRRLSREGLIVKDMNWFALATEPDSLPNPGYCSRFFPAAGVTDPVLLSVRDTLSGGLVISCSFCNRDPHAPPAFQDTLYYHNPDLFFTGLVKRLLPEPPPLLDGNCFPQTCDEWKLLGEARRNELFGDRSLARSVYRRLDSLRTGIPAVECGLARTLISEGREKSASGGFAEDDFLQAKNLLLTRAAVDTTEAAVFTLLGTIAVLREEWNQARYYLGKALSLDRNDPVALMALSRLHQTRIRELGYRSRLALYKRCLELNPADVTAILAAGDAYYFRNLPGKSIQLYRQLLRLNPNSIDALMALGKIYVLKNDVLNIITTYEKILALRPEYGDAFYNLGIAYFNDEKPEEAVQLFRRALELQGNRNSHYYLGVIFFRQGERDSAVEQFRARIRAKTGFDDTYAEESRKLLYRILNDSTYVL